MFLSQICGLWVNRFERPFRKLKLCDKSWVEAACKADGSINCYVNFVMMYLTQAEYESDSFREYCGCVIKRPWSEDDKLYIQYPIGAPKNRQKALKKILRYYSGPYKQIIFYAATEEHLKEIKELYADSIIEVRQDRDNQDYIVDVKAQISLEGPEYRNKRKKVIRFNRKYNCTYEPVSAENMEECRSVNQSWFTAQERGHEAAQEQKSMLLAFDEFEELNLQGELCRIDGRPVSIYIGTPLNQSVYLCLFMKADTSYTDISLAAENAFLERHCSNFTYVNEGVDMGLPGLRTFKQNMHPVMMTSFYYITLDVSK